MRSIRLNAFHYRIVYEVQENNPSKKIIVHAIAHRKNVYFGFCSTHGTRFGLFLSRDITRLMMAGFS